VFGEFLREQAVRAKEEEKEGERGRAEERKGIKEERLSMTGR
jgi:hypothetical protein